MQIEIKKKLLAFLQKIIENLPGMDMEVINREAFELEINLRLSEHHLSLHTPPEMHQLLSNISEYQGKHYETIAWLIDPMGPRASGRTELMALAFIHHSLYYGTWVTVFDHSTHPQSTKEIIDRIAQLVNKAEGLTFAVKKQQRTQILISRSQIEPYKLKGECEYGR